MSNTTDLDHTRPIVYTTDLSSKYTELHANPFELPLLLTMLQGKRALDVGCGSGRLLKPLQDLGFEVHGAETSPAMLAAARSRGCINLVDVDVRDRGLMLDVLRYTNPQIVYLSFSLHQIHPNISDQRDYLTWLLDACQCPVLLITTLPEYFEVNPTTRFSGEAKEIDLKRFPSRHWYLNNFTVTSMVDLLVNTKETREAFVKGIDSKHISTFQLTTEDELVRIKEEASKVNFIPQVHSYIQLG